MCSFSGHIESVRKSSWFYASKYVQYPTTSADFQWCHPGMNCHHLSPRSLQAPSHCSCIYQDSLWSLLNTAPGVVLQDTSSTTSFFCMAFHLTYGHTRDFMMAYKARGPVTSLTSYPTTPPPCSLCISKVRLNNGSPKCPCPNPWNLCMLLEVTKETL